MPLVVPLFSQQVYVNRSYSRVCPTCSDAWISLCCAWRLPLPFTAEASLQWWSTLSKPPSPVHGLHVLAHSTFLCHAILPVFCFVILFAFPCLLRAIKVISTICFILTLISIFYVAVVHLWVCYILQLFVCWITDWVIGHFEVCGPSCTLLEIVRGGVWPPLSFLKK